MSEQTTFDSWAVIELFGHSVIVGRVTEASIGGCSFLRVDVPATNGQAEFTRFFGNGAIYSMTPVTEDVARAALLRHTPRPVSAYGILPAATPNRDEIDGEDYERGSDDDEY